MSSVLTRDEYAAIASSLTLPTIAWMNGKFASARSGETFESINPATGEKLADIASCDNVVAKLGGLAMPDNGYGWHRAERPPSSDELVAAQRRWYEHTIECFGPDRCMFESNFPVDRFSVSYTVYWNAMQRLAAQYSEPEQAAMFAGTARRVYRL